MAAGLGVTPTQLKTWRLELEAAGSAAASAVQKAQAAELAQLRRDNKRLTEKVEVPAQSLGFFLDRHEACARDLNLLDPLTFFSKSEAATCPCSMPMLRPWDLLSPIVPMIDISTSPFFK